MRCALGTVGVCPMVGTITSSTGNHTGATIEMTPQTVRLNPLGTYSSIHYTELAFTMVGGGDGPLSFVLD